MKYRIGKPHRVANVNLIPIERRVFPFCWVFVAHCHSVDEAIKCLTELEKQHQEIDKFNKRSK